MSRDLPTLGSFDPDTLRVLYKAFDDVWLELGPKTAPAIREATRNAVASALMQAAVAGERDPERLWCHALNRGRALSTLYWMTTETQPQRDAI